MGIPILITGILIALFIGAGVVALVIKSYRKVDQGQALIINKVSKVEVSFQGGVVIPIIHRAETMDLSVKTIEIDRSGSDGLICQDNIRADIKVSFFVRISKTEEDVKNVAASIGCERASSQATLEELFSAKFSEALKTVGKGLDFVELYEQRDKFKDEIIATIGTDLNGYLLEDAAIDYLEQTPLSALDNNNILDAQGIKKITELTAEQHILTNDFRQNERKQIKKQDVEAQEAILALERQQADAENKQKREIETMKAREVAETKRVQAEEFSKSEQARLKAEEEVEIQNENKVRQVQVAQKNRERVIGIEIERVEKDRQLEAIARERETELERIQKEKAVEVEKKNIAEVVRGRIAVDKTVAEEEERIKTLRVVEEADRQKAAVILNAEAEAEESLVKATKAAEAQEIAASHEAKKILITAQADLEAADKEAKAKIRLAEGAQAQQAASGLAEARVKEANAVALEKEGLAEVRVKEAHAAAIEKEGLATALVTKEQLTAEADGNEKQGLADARVKEADAAAIEKVGQAEAAAVRDRMLAEATGLTEKAQAMNALEGTAKEHEEFRIQLEMRKEVDLASIVAKKDIARAQADVLAQAFKQADIKIVGGEGEFFNQFVKAISLGHAMDGAIDSSKTINAVTSDYVNGNKDLAADLKDILSRPALSSGDVTNLTLAGVLGKLMSGSDSKTRDKLNSLLQAAQKLGLDDINAG